MIPSVTQVTSSCCTTSSSFTMNLDVHFFSRLISFSVYSPPRPAPSFLIAKYSLLGGFCALNTSPKALALIPQWHSKPFSNSVHKNVIAYCFLSHFLDAVSLRLDDKLGVLAVVRRSTVWLSSVDAMLRCDVTLCWVHSDCRVFKMRALYTTEMRVDDWKKKRKVEYGNPHPSFLCSHIIAIQCSTLNSHTMLSKTATSTNAHPFLNSLWIYPLSDEYKRLYQLKRSLPKALANGEETYCFGLLSCSFTR